MSEPHRTPTDDPRVTQYHRMAGYLTHTEVLHPSEKEAAIAAHPLWRRKSARQRLLGEWAEREAEVCGATEGLVQRYETTIERVDTVLNGIHLLGRERLGGKVEDERARLVRARGSLGEVRAALREKDFEKAGRAMHDADRELWSLGGPLIMALGSELQSAAFSRELREAITRNQVQRKEARARVESVRAGAGWPEAFEESLTTYQLLADGLSLVTEGLAQSGPEVSFVGRSARVGNDNAVRVTPPQELERLDDVGGLAAVKDQLRRALDPQFERPEDAARYKVGAGGILLYGPPGTGKTLLARAVAGQYGLRFLRVVPAAIASPYAHETAKNLSRIFETARQAAPCLLFLDEVDALASARAALPSAEHREIVTQLLSLLEEYRRIPGLVVMAATNALDLLDPALREGRFDTKVAVPMPSADARKHILEIHLRERAEAVAWGDVDIDRVVAQTAGYSGAALARLVESAAEHALRAGRQLGQHDLVEALGERVGRDRVELETPVRWEDVVLPAALQDRLRQILEVVQHPEAAEAIGVAPPTGVLLYGPPGTGKTTIAKALATEVRGSFYEMSSAELLSKWVGESEERVAKLFARARENRPSIIFIDEIDGLLRRRSASSAAPWEERIVGQFLRELDGLRSAAGIFLVGATNRLDIIDEAIVERRLVALEVPLPDEKGRHTLLGQLFVKLRLAADVDLDEIARATDGMSGADLKRLRDDIGLDTLSRSIRLEVSSTQVEVAAADIYRALQQRRVAVIPD